MRRFTFSGGWDGGSCDEVMGDGSERVLDCKEVADVIPLVLPNGYAEWCAEYNIFVIRVVVVTPIPFRTS